MAVAPKYVVTDEWFVWLSGEMPPKIRDAICKWCEFHGLDPRKIVRAAGVMRAPEKCRILYTEFICDEDGTIQVGANGELRQVMLIEQGEAPPLPFPQIILDLASTTTQNDPSR
jgi:hypothetical protein